MSKTIEQYAPQLPEQTTTSKSLGGLAMGTIVQTLDGALPVEYLFAGDRLITRAGMCKVREITVHTFKGHPYRIAAGALGNEAPERDLLVPPGQRVRLQGKRAEALTGTDEALVPVEMLFNGTTVSKALDVTELRAFTLIFDKEEVLYADGLEMASTR
ncbi:Hint domain-containing protein [Actibacterium lipolyticum]|uniref:Hedgehog/Intein (Hint) domain-containing protein n=1 Tax=Actibacterium lipolyticum TaxID=1524263 RepID=A0A238KHK3_9RHOB|nr:Hint domain-containing protein [Actibacterium lipolyticum]SMX42178.1 hypothetical protein COL8621_01904 [Actibacterium lipolyticum]